jgi:hypothetical protein
MTARCSRCKKFVRKHELEVVDGKTLHKNRTGCRKNEPFEVSSVPEPAKIVRTFEKSQVATVHTGPINGLGAALMRAGVVRVRPSESA